MSTEYLRQFSRINRHCGALAEIAKQGELGSEGIAMIMSTGNLHNLTRNMLGGGLDFIHYLELDIESFANGQEYRPGMEMCNRAMIMAKVFRLRNPFIKDRPFLRKDGTLPRNSYRINRSLERVRANLDLSDSVLNQLSNGVVPRKRELKKVFNFMKKKSQGYEQVSNNATEKAFSAFRTPVVSAEQNLVVVVETPPPSGLDARFELLRAQFSQGLLRNTATDDEARLKQLDKQYTTGLIDDSSIVNPDYTIRVKYQ